MKIVKKGSQSSKQRNYFQICRKTIFPYLISFDRLRIESVVMMSMAFSQSSQQNSQYQDAQLLSTTLQKP